MTISDEQLRNAAQRHAGRNFTGMMAGELLAARDEIRGVRGLLDLMEVDHITGGSIGPLMDHGYAVACKSWAKRLRKALAKVGA